jgi:hypothetical protein
MVPWKQKNKTPLNSKLNGQNRSNPTIRVVSAKPMTPTDQQRLESLIGLLIERRVRHLTKGESS